MIKIYEFFSEAKPTTKQESLILGSIKEMLAMPTTFATIQSGVAYVSNDIVDYHIQVSAGNVSYDNHAGFKSSPVREGFSDLLTKEVLNYLETRVKKIKEISEKNEISFLETTLEKIRVVNESEKTLTSVA